MLSEVFASAVRIRALRDGPAGELFEGFAQTLFQSGYAKITARYHFRSAEHLISWADRTGTPVCCLTEQSLERFGLHLRRCRCTRYGHTNPVNVLHGARLFFTHLRDAGVISRAAVASIVQDPPLLTDFCDWMRQLRGVCEATLYNYCVHIRKLLSRLGQEPEKFCARNLRQFVMEASQECGWAAAKKCTTALRMFLRFLIAEGKCTAGLDAAIPVLAHWRLASLPRYLCEDDVERLITSCDLASPVGTRDRAILLLLARLGLRAGDIVQLRLCDIDWKHAWIDVHGKGRRHTRLPLTHEVGYALAEYLKHGRPRTEADAVFVCCRAPFHAFSSHCAVSVIVDRALRRAGVARPSRGAAHLLRHSVASSMLRHGASLQDIAQLLRHRSIETTQIYAKIDVLALRKIAQPWPEVPPC
jgi:site-specific recombinase XerD